MKNVKIWKYSGIFLIATGILHTIVAIMLGKDVFWGIIENGLYGLTTIDYERAFAIWFFICGIFVILLGQVLHYYIKKRAKTCTFVFWLQLVDIYYFRVYR
jgi:hypothetical protein